MITEDEKKTADSCPAGMNCYVDLIASLDNYSQHCIATEQFQVADLLFNTVRTLHKMKAGISAIRSLINESHGVAGLHLNGDVAEWTELEQGGRFEEWLIKFNEAET